MVVAAAGHVLCTCTWFSSVLLGGRRRCDRSPTNGGGRCCCRWRPLRRSSPQRSWQRIDAISAVVCGPNAAAGWLPFRHCPVPSPSRGDSARNHRRLDRRPRPVRYRDRVVHGRHRRSTRQQRRHQRRTGQVRRHHDRTVVHRRRAEHGRHHGGGLFRVGRATSAQRGRVGSGRDRAGHRHLAPSVGGGVSTLRRPARCGYCWSSASPSG